MEVLTSQLRLECDVSVFESGLYGLLGLDFLLRHFGNDSLLARKLRPSVVVETCRAANKLKTQSWKISDRTYLAIGLVAVEGHLKRFPGALAPRLVQRSL